VKTAELGNPEDSQIGRFSEPPSEKNGSPDPECHELSNVHFSQSTDVSQNGS